MKRFLRSARQIAYNAFFGTMHIHHTAAVHFKSRVSRDVIARPWSFISWGCYIQPQVEIGRYSMLGPNVHITGGDHVITLAGTPMIFSGRPPVKPTIIGDDVWIGAGTIILQGVRIGNGAVIGANSTVTKDIPPVEIWAGSPAVKLRDRFSCPAEAEKHLEMLAGPTINGTLAGPIRLRSRTSTG